jgi:DNA adenine methylase
MESAISRPLGQAGEKASPFFRFPGGKRVMAAEIGAYILWQAEGLKDVEYREPFLGAGAVGLHVLSKVLPTAPAWINDRDPGIACLWMAVVRHPEALKARVMAFQPSVAAFDEYKAALVESPDFTDPVAVLDLGFKKLALHQISRSGLGVKAGQPLGGRDQSWGAIDGRWNAERICRDIDLAHSVLAGRRQHGRCTNVDFAELIADAPANTIIYLDPPYYAKGPGLYLHAFGPEDHVRLRDALAQTRARWVLSYDDVPQVRSLYREWATLHATDMTRYSIQARATREILITPR